MRRKARLQTPLSKVEWDLTSSDETFFRVDIQTSLSPILNFTKPELSYKKHRPRSYGRNSKKKFATFVKTERT